MLGRRVLVLAGVLLASGCGGRTGIDDQSSDSGTAADGGPWGVPSEGGAWSTVCPATQPTTGGACGGDAVCEYGSAWWDVSCDTVMQCTAGAWAIDDVSSES